MNLINEMKYYSGVMDKDDLLTEVFEEFKADKAEQIGNKLKHFAKQLTKEKDSELKGKIELAADKFTSLAKDLKEVLIKRKEAALIIRESKKEAKANIKTTEDLTKRAELRGKLNSAIQGKRKEIKKAIQEYVKEFKTLVRENREFVGVGGTGERFKTVSKMAGSAISIAGLITLLGAGNVEVSNKQEIIRDLESLKKTVVELSQETNKLEQAYNTSEQRGWTEAAKMVATGLAAAAAGAFTAGAARGALGSTVGKFRKAQRQAERRRRKALEVAIKKEQKTKKKKPVGKRKKSIISQKERDRAEDIEKPTGVKLRSSGAIENRSPSVIEL